MDINYNKGIQQLSKISIVFDDLGSIYTINIHQTGKSDELHLITVLVCTGDDWLMITGGYYRSFADWDGPSQDGFCDAFGLHGAFGFGHQKLAHAADAEAQTRGDQQGEPGPWGGRKGRIGKDDTGCKPQSVVMWKKHEFRKFRSQNVWCDDMQKRGV